MRDILQVEVRKPDLQLGARVVNACLSRRLLASETRQMRSRLIPIATCQLELGQTQQRIGSPR